MSWLLCSLIRDIETKRALSLDDNCFAAIRADVYILWLLCFFDLYVSSVIGLYQHVDLLGFLSIWMFVSLASSYWAWSRSKMRMYYLGIEIPAFFGKPVNTLEQSDWADEVLNRLDLNFQDEYARDEALNPDYFFNIQQDLCINRKMLKAVIKQGKNYFIQLHPPHDEMEIQVCSGKRVAFWNWYNHVPKGNFLGNIPPAPVAKPIQLIS